MCLFVECGRVFLVYSNSTHFNNLTFIKLHLRRCPPTCSDASLDWLTPDCGPAPGPTPADGHHSEVVLSPWKHSAHDALSQAKLCDWQMVWGRPLKAEVVIVPEVGTKPRQLYCLIGWALFDRQLGGRLWSWEKKYKQKKKQNKTNPIN